MVSNTPQDSRATASGVECTQVVYAREWGFKYVSRFYMDPELTVGWSPGATNKWFAYRGIPSGDGTLNVDWGNEYASTRAGAPLWTDNTGYLFGKSLTFRDMKWTAQFDQNGKKVIRTAEPCVAELDPATGGNVNPCTKPPSCQFGNMDIVYNRSNNTFEIIQESPWNYYCGVEACLECFWSKLTNGKPKESSQRIIGVASLEISSPRLADCFGSIGTLTLNQGGNSRISWVNAPPSGRYSSNHVILTITNCSAPTDAFPAGSTGTNWLWAQGSIPGGCTC